MIAVISLRFEDEISIDSLSEDLKSIVNYLINPNEMVRNLQYFSRAGIIKVDWQKRTLKREKSLKEYVTKNVMTSELWPTMAEDWHRMNTAIRKKRGTVNPEYQQEYSPNQT
jgi:hypothetical protein